MKRSVCMSVEVEVIRLSELGNQNERSEGVEMVVEGTACSGHFERKRAVGLYLVNSVIVGRYCPVEVFPVVRSYADGGELDAGPIQVIVLAVSLTRLFASVVVGHGLVADALHPF